MLLGLDYDGTLVEICPRPEDAKISRERRAILKALLAHKRFLPVFISGRKIDELLCMLRLPPCWAVGDHGATIKRPGGKAAVCVPVPKRRILAELETSLKQVCALDKRLWLEAKSASVALHYRQVPPKKARAAVASAIEIYRRKFRRNFELMPMKKVIEFIVPGVTKGRALQHVHRMVGGGMPVLYFGDDTTDHSAIEYAEKHGHAVFVGKRNKMGASWRLPDPNSVYQLLRNILN